MHGAYIMFLIYMRNTYYLDGMKPDYVQNLIGAMALSLSDEIIAEADRVAPRNDPSASIALIGRSPGWTIRDLAHDLRLSHAAAVRLVDRLVGDGLMTRQRSDVDRRAVQLSLTDDGNRAYAELLRSRHRRLGEALASLTSNEQQMLAKLSAKLLTSIAADTGETSRMCRFCDTTSCTNCPIDDVGNK